MSAFLRRLIIAQWNSDDTTAPSSANTLFIERNWHSSLCTDGSTCSLHPASVRGMGDGGDAILNEGDIFGNRHLKEHRKHQVF
jgi:hypothetical protein